MPGEPRPRPKRPKGTAPPLAPPPTPEPPPAAASASAYRVGDAAEFGRNMAQVAVRSRDLLSAFVKAQAARSGREPLDPLNITGAYYSLFKDMAAQSGARPQRAARLLAGLHDAGPAQRRTRNGPHGRTRCHARADRPSLPRQGLAGEPGLRLHQAVLSACGELAAAKPSRRRTAWTRRPGARALFYARQFADAIAPTNFVLTNPEVLRETLKSNGENLVRGLDNLLSDLKRGQGNLSIRQTTDNFVIGRDIATDAGQGRLPERAVRADPIRADDQDGLRDAAADLPAVDQQVLHPRSAAEELLRALGGRARLHRVHGVVGQSRQPRSPSKSFDDYMREGIFAALDAVEKATGQTQVNTIGYCIAGTLLGATLAYIAASGEYKDRDQDRPPSSPPRSISRKSGDLQVFVDDEQLEALEDPDARGGRRARRLARWR